MVKIVVTGNNIKGLELVINKLKKFKDIELLEDSVGILHSWDEFNITVLFHENEIKVLNVTYKPKDERGQVVEKDYNIAICKYAYEIILPIIKKQGIEGIDIIIK